ncbi:MAG: MBL fold metallo-hydrolase [Caulobacterales bacterium]|nr:MBL fold metallo-hydrolase [Caulobacterales bacterium]
MIFRQLIDLTSSNFTYLLADEASREAILIDPVFEQAQRDAALIEELGLTLTATVETHVHADHVTSAWLLRERLGSQILIGAASRARGADRYLKHGDKIAFGRRYVTARATPGHTAGCMTFVLDDESRAFTGDALLVRGAGRTDFQGGDPIALYRSVHSQIFTLPEACLLYPGHDYRGLTVTSVGEERAFNPRLGGALSETDFAGYMNNLKLDHPGKMEVAVPANLNSGKPDGEAEIGPEQGWAPLSFTFAGIWEIDPRWVAEHAGAAQIADVREPEEFEGPLGHVEGAALIPLASLPDGAAGLDKDRPVVAVCRAGGRSAQATLLLRKAGFTQVANLAGGMLRWRALDLPVVGGAE